ncbi:MAG TPA: hypothetical protein VJO14_03625 [Bacteroidota bacterium]|nr:hypothetical protein [Bacteroidota bacterium]
MKNFLLSSALTTTVLYLDDFFQFHDRIFPDYLGVPQVLILAIYAVWILTYLLVNYGTIRKTEDLLFFSAIAFLGISAVVDYFDEPVRLTGHHLWEDGTKFLGIVGWCVYFVRLSFSIVSERFSGRDVPG